MLTPSVFISYSHQDEVWKDRLVKQLAVLEKQGLLKTWSDRDIGAGDEWFEEIRNAMNTARVAIVLISADSLASKFILHTEVPHFLKRRTQEGMTVFPVLCKDCLWQEIPWLAKLQARPRDGRALASFRGNKVDSELAKIAKEILEIARKGPAVSTDSGSATSNTGTSLPALYQIPSPLADFTGRTEELSSLKAALTGGRTLAIFGMGGVGKSALAFKLAEDLALLYPDAQLYLDLKGVDPHPLSATQAMAHVVRSFHPDVRLPEGEAEMAGLYRSVLHGKRALLLMDNAGADRKQVEPLIPPPGSLLLVTSRFHFTLPGLVARNLDELPNEDARALLLRIAPRIGSAADEIARLCGRLPLALRLAGSALAERPNLSPADYARRLGAGKELDSVEASLNVSYGLLSEDLRRLWHLLAVFPGTFDGPAAAAIWNLEADPASDAIGDLLRSSLVERDDKDGRYRLHDLARSFADRRLEGAEKEVARRRHAEHYLGVLRAADDLYKKGGESQLLGLRLFDTEWGNIQEGQAWAAAHFSENAEVARICDDYPDAGAFLLEVRQRPRDQIRWRESALAAAQQRQNRGAEGIHLGSLGNAYRNLGEPRRAIEFYEQVLAIAREIGDRRNEGTALGCLGLAYVDLGEPRRAIEFHEQHLAIAGETFDRLGEANALGNLGNAYADLGEPRRAIELYEQQLAIAREIGHRLGEAYASWNLGLAIEREGDLARAADLMQICIDYLRELGHPDAEKTAVYLATLRARIAEQNS